VEQIRFDLGLATGPLAVSLKDGEVTAVGSAAQHPEARPATEREQKSFRDHLLGRGAFLYPMSWAGLTAFQRQVIEELGKVPFGQRVSYQELARRVGRPKAARAVGSAMAKNPYPLLYPCHRVVPSSGGIGQFSFGGPEVKAGLLTWEERQIGDH
jgi:methylated-DNA-[protein]-cysteine S-methyltransferase